MKHTILSIAVLLGICCWSMPQVAMADDTPAVETTGKKKKKEKKPRNVVQAFKNMTFFNAEEPAAVQEGEEKEEKKEDAIAPNNRAKYYIYLSSASWCGPCKALMPKVVAQYKAMKKKKVEVILISCDSSIEEGRKYLQHYKAPFCGVMAGEAADKNLPGYKAASSIPYAIVVDKKGKVVTAGNGASIFETWKDICK